MAARVQGFAWPVSSAMPLPGRANRKASTPSTPAVTPRGTSSSTAALSRLATAEEDRAAGPSGCSDILENWVVSWADKMRQALADAQLEASRPNSARGVSGMVPHSARNNRDGMNRRGTDSFRASLQNLNSGGRGKGRQVGASGRGRQQSDSDRRVGSKPSNGSPRVPLPPDSLAAVSALNKLERALQPYLQGAAGSHHSIEAFLSPRYTRASVHESSTSHDMRLGGNSNTQRQSRPSTAGQSQFRQTKVSVGGSPSSANASRRPPATRTSLVPPLSGMQRDGAAMRTGSSSFGHSQSSRPSPLRQQHTAWPEHQGAASSSRAGSNRRFASPEKAAIMGSPRSSLMPEVITRSSLAAGNLTPASSQDASVDGPRTRRSSGGAPEPSWEAVNEEDGSTSPLQAHSLQTSPFDADASRPLDEQALQWRLDRMQSLILQAQQHTEEQQHYLRADLQELTRLRASEGQSSFGLSGRTSNEDISSSDESSLVEDEPMGRLKS